MGWGLDPEDADAIVIRQQRFHVCGVTRDERDRKDVEAVSRDLGVRGVRFSAGAKEFTCLSGNPQVGRRYGAPLVK